MCVSDSETETESERDPARYLYEDLVVTHVFDNITDVRARLLQQLQLLTQVAHYTYLSSHQYLDQALVTRARSRSRSWGGVYLWRCTRYVEPRDVDCFVASLE